MNSSTSNFKKSSQGRGAWGIGLALLLFFGVAEVGARKYSHRRDNDLSDPTEHASIGPRAADLMTKPGLKIVFVGNSATQEGYELPQFERDLTQMAALQAPLHTMMCAAVDSNAREWNWMLEKNYFGPRRRPDLFVVTYFSNNLEDVPLLERGRLAHSFTGPRDWPSVLKNDLDTLGERADYLFSYFSILYAMRATTREKLLRLSAPGYEKFVTQLNDTEMRREEGATLPSAPAFQRGAQPSYRALRRLLQRAREEGARLCFVAYPRPGARYFYRPDPKAVQMIREAGMIALDLRATPGLTPDKYRDSVHVNAQGKPIWTRAVAKALAPVVAELKTSPGR